MADHLMKRQCGVPSRSLSPTRVTVVKGTSSRSSSSSPAPASPESMSILSSVVCVEMVGFARGCGKGSPETRYVAKERVSGVTELLWNVASSL